MKKGVLLLTCFSITVCCLAQESGFFTDSLMQKWNKAWNQKNVAALTSMVQPNVVFESPYNIRISRDSLAASIFKYELPRLGNIQSTELHSQTDGDMAWSIGEVTGIENNEPWKATYTFEFTRKNGGNWKIQLLVFYEK